MLTITEFDYVRQLVRDRAAIVIDEGKDYLIESRLAPLVRQEGATSIADLVGRMRDANNRHLEERVVEAMTTNETSWFRDVHPYDALRESILPEIMQKRTGSRELVIWSAASSAGQELYSIAMLIRETFPQLASWHVRMLGTDISGEMVAKAKAGCYTGLEVNRGLPAPLLVKYFTKQGLHYEIDERLRSSVEFRVLNLAVPWAPLPPVDLLFMRNVLIYFDIRTKKEILTRVRRLMRPDGYLFLGSAETTLNLDEGFERVQIGKASVYRIKG